MSRLPLTCMSAVLLLLGSSSTILPAQEIPPAALDSLAGRGSLLFTRTDGSFVQGKVTETSADSLFLDKGRMRKAVARDDIAQVWQKKKTVLQSALYGAGLGAVGGAFLELSLGTCDLCSSGGDVLEAAALGALGRGLEGALVGWLGGHWKPLVPAPEAARAQSPWDPWGASVRVGAAHRYNVDSDENAFTGGFTGWKNTRPGSSWGFEYGTLSRSSHQESGSYTYQDSSYVSRTVTFVDDVRDNWAYSAICWRARGSGSGLRGFVTSGFGGYLHRRIYERANYDSSTARSYEYSGLSTEFRTGINLGGGISTGTGDWRPAVDVRGHWSFAADEIWLTVQAGVDFH